MPMKQEMHVIKGMQRDLTVSRFNPEFAYENMNIRITARDNNTLMAVTNERGNIPISLYLDSDRNTELNLDGLPLGYCVIKDCIALFTKGDTDNIYRIHKEDDKYITKVLFSGDLGFDVSYPIQTLGSFENENIQKVYWVDGINQARVVNIVSDEEYTDPSQFNFARYVTSTEEVTVTKDPSGSGTFHSGVIQYAVSYYTKNAQESTIIYSSPLLYISPIGRGGSPEEMCNCSFNIQITNVNKTFSGVNIYSIYRTSLDATPSTKLVTSLPINGDTDVLSYTDSGSGGSTIDPTELLYKGGEEIVPYTIAQKDNTLFLGNLTIKRSSIPEIVREHISELTVFSDNKTEPVMVNDNASSFYNYKGYLDYDSDKATTFKKGEEYRLGMIALHKTGKWSEAIPIGDHLMTERIINTNNERYNLTEFRCIVHRYLLNELRDLGYIAIKPVVVFPSYSDRNILAQGILCPTNYLRTDRDNNSPYAMSSWFVRPKVVKKDGPVDIDAAWGTIAHFTHNSQIGGKNADEPANAAEYRNCETPAINAGGVDENIVTFHSPEIVFDNNIKEYVTNSKLRIVGYVRIDANAIDYSVTANSTYKVQSTVNWNYGLIPNVFGSYSKVLAHRRLITAGIWRDGLVVEKNIGQGDLWTEDPWHAAYAVYPWGRSVLNNDWRDETGILNRKIMSTLLYANTEYFIGDYYNFEVEGNEYRRGITPVTIFDSDEVSMERLPVPENSIDNEQKTYRGNYSGVIQSAEDYFAKVAHYSYEANDSGFWDDSQMFTVTPIIAIPTDLGPAPHFLFGPYTRKFQDACEIKYKSSPHAVFTLNNTGFYTKKLLPSAGENDTIPTEIIPNAEIPAPKQTISASITVNDTFPSNPNIGDYLFMFSDFIKLRGSLWRYNSTPSGNTWVKEENPPTGADTVYKLGSLSGSWYLNKLTSSTENVTWQLIKSDNVPRYSKDDLSDKINEVDEIGILWLAELYRDGISNKFGGATDNAYSNNIWLPAGKTISLEGKQADVTLHFTQGDTYYQRFDCLKTYSFSDDAKNNIVEIISFMCETRVNIDGRYDRNRGQEGNLSMSPANFNLFNPVYSQKDNFFKYNYLALDVALVNRFPNTVTWTGEKTSGALTDAWTNITMASTLDLDGDKGEVTSLNTFKNEIFCFQEQGLSNIIFNPRVQIPTSDEIPIEISNSYKVQGKRYINNIIGCKNKWSICETVNSIYFIDNLTNALYKFDGSSLSPISDMLGFRQFIGENNSLSIWNPKDYGNFRTFYDKTNDDVYFINDKYCLCYSELLQQFTSFMSYERTPLMFNFEDKFFSIKNSKVWEQNAGDYNYFFGEFKPYYVTIIANQDEPSDKIYNTIEYRANVFNNGVLKPDSTFSNLEVWNEYQHGALDLTNRIGHPSPLKRKFRIWRANIPRDNGNRNRIRNIWAYVRLSNNIDNKDSMQLYDIGVTYFV